MKNSNSGCKRELDLSHESKSSPTKRSKTTNLIDRTDDVPPNLRAAGASASELANRMLVALQLRDTGEVLETLSLCFENLGASLTANPNYYLPLIYLAKVAAPNLCQDDRIWQFLVTQLKSGSEPQHFKKNNYGHILAASMLYCGFKHAPKWPVEFVQAYLEDAFCRRMWVDEHLCTPFCTNVLTVLHTQETLYKEGQESASKARPFLLSHRFPEQTVRERVATYVHDILNYHLGQQQLQQHTPTSNDQLRNIIRVMIVTSPFVGVRLLASSHLGQWLQNPVTTVLSRELFSNVIAHTHESTQNDLIVVQNLFRINMVSFGTFVTDGLSGLMKFNPFYSRVALREVLQSDHLLALVDGKNPLGGSPAAFKGISKLLESIWVTLPADQREEELAALIQELVLNFSASNAVKQKLYTIFQYLPTSTTDHKLCFKKCCVALFQPVYDFERKSDTIKQAWCTYIADVVSHLQVLSLSNYIQKCAPAAACSTGGVLERLGQEEVDRIQLELTEIHVAAMNWCQAMSQFFSSTSQSESWDAILERLLKRLLFLDPCSTYVASKAPHLAESGHVFKSVFSLLFSAPVSLDAILRAASTSVNQTNELLDVVGNLCFRAIRQQKSWKTTRLLISDFRASLEIFRLAAYPLPPSIRAVLSDPLDPPFECLASLPSQLVVRDRLWKACAVLVFSSVANLSFGYWLWTHVPTLRSLIEIFLMYSWRWPPAGDGNVLWLHRDLERQEQVAFLRLDEYLREAHPALHASPDVASLLKDLPCHATLFRPEGPSRAPPKALIQLMKRLDYDNQFSHLLISSRDPDFVLDVMKDKGCRAGQWLAHIVKVEPSIMRALPALCVMRLLLETQTQRLSSLESAAPVHAIHIAELLRQRVATESGMREVLEFFLPHLCSAKRGVRVATKQSMALLLSTGPAESVARAWSSSTDDFVLERLRACPADWRVSSMLLEHLIPAIRVERDDATLHSYFTYIHDIHTDADGRLSLDGATILVREWFLVGARDPFLTSSLLERRSNVRAQVRALCVLFAAEGRAFRGEPASALLRLRPPCSDACACFEVPRIVLDAFLALCASPCLELESSERDQFDRLVFRLFRLDCLPPAPSRPVVDLERPTLVVFADQQGETPFDLWIEPELKVAWARSRVLPVSALGVAMLSSEQLCLLLCPSFLSPPTTRLVALKLEWALARRCPFRLDEDARSFFATRVRAAFSPDEVADCLPALAQQLFKAPLTRTHTPYTAYELPSAVSPARPCAGLASARAAGRGEASSAFRGVVEELCHPGAFRGGDSLDLVTAFRELVDSPSASEVRDLPLLLFCVHRVVSLSGEESARVQWRGALEEWLERYRGDPRWTRNLNVILGRVRVSSGAPRGSEASFSPRPEAPARVSLCVESVLRGMSPTFHFRLVSVGPADAKQLFFSAFSRRAFCPVKPLLIHALLCCSDLRSRALFYILSPKRPASQLDPTASLDFVDAVVRPRPDGPFDAPDESPLVRLRFCRERVQKLIDLVIDEITRAGQRGDLFRSCQRRARLLLFCCRKKPRPLDGAAIERLSEISDGFAARTDRWLQCLAELLSKQSRSRPPTSLQLLAEFCRSNIVAPPSRADQPPTDAQARRLLHQSVYLMQPWKVTPPLVSPAESSDLQRRPSGLDPLLHKLIHALSKSELVCVSCQRLLKIVQLHAVPFAKFLPTLHALLLDRGGAPAPRAPHAQLVETLSEIVQILWLRTPSEQLLPWTQPLLTELVHRHVQPLRADGFCAAARRVALTLGRIARFAEEHRIASKHPWIWALQADSSLSGASASQPHRDASAECALAAACGAEDDWYLVQLQIETCHPFLRRHSSLTGLVSECYADAACEDQPCLNVMVERLERICQDLSEFDALLQKAPVVPSAASCHHVSFIETVTRYWAWSTASISSDLAPAKSRTCAPIRVIDSVCKVRQMAYQCVLRYLRKSAEEREEPMRMYLSCLGHERADVRQEAVQHAGEFYSATLSASWRSEILFRLASAGREASGDLSALIETELELLL